MGARLSLQIRVGAAIAALALQAVGAGAQTCIAPPADLVSWWTGDGSTADRLGGNPGTSHGGVSFPAGMVAQSLGFNGVDGYVSVGNPASLRLSASDFTVDTWVYFTGLVSPAGPSGPCFGPGCDMALLDKIVSDGTAANRDGWRLFKQSDDRIWFCLGAPSGNGCVPDSATTVRTIAPVSAGTWYHVAAVKQTTGIRLYLNGALQEQKPLPTHVNTDSASLEIGRHSETLYTSLLYGRLDEIEIHRRALSLAEIQSIYTAGSAGKCKTAPVPALGDLALVALAILLAGTSTWAALRYRPTR